MADLNANINISSLIRQDLSNKVPGSSGYINYGSLSSSKYLDQNSYPNLSLKYVNIISTTTTLDFTALNDPIDGTVNATGQQLLFAYLHNSSSTSATISPGGSNPYLLFGSNPVTLYPNETIGIYCESLPTVTGSSKTLTITTSGHVTVAFGFGTTTTTASP